MKLFNKKGNDFVTKDSVKSADFLTTVLPEGVMYLTIRRVSKGWVVEALTFKNNELVLEKLCEPSMRGTALIKFKKLTVTKLLKYAG